MVQLTVDDVSARLLGGQDVPPDLRRLIEIGARQGTDGDVAPSGALATTGFDLIDPTATGFVLIDPDQLPGLVGHSYLNERDRADPDIMANIHAIDEVFALSAFVAVGDEDDIVGYWQGPDRVPLDQAPFVIYNSEGQFSLLPGATITEALVIYSLQARFDEAEVQTRFEEMCESFRAFGINLAIRDLAMVKVQPTRVEPAELHRRAYTKFRTEAGLSPI